MGSWIPVAPVTTMWVSGPFEIDLDAVAARLEDEEPPVGINLDRCGAPEQLYYAPRLVAQEVVGRGVQLGLQVGGVPLGFQVLVRRGEPLLGQL